MNGSRAVVLAMVLGSCARAHKPTDVDCDEVLATASAVLQQRAGLAWARIEEMPEYLACAHAELFISEFSDQTVSCADARSQHSVPVPIPEIAHARAVLQALEDECWSLDSPAFEVLAALDFKSCFSDAYETGTLPSRLDLRVDIPQGGSPVETRIVQSELVVYHPCLSGLVRDAAFPAETWGTHVIQSFVYEPVATLDSPSGLSDEVVATLSGSEALGVCLRHGCCDRAEPHTLTVSFTIEASGAVTDVSLDEEHRDPALGACVRGALEDVRFLGSTPGRVAYPLVITPSP